MSRTDKDAPNWVRAINDPRAEEWHGGYCERSDFIPRHPGTGWAALARPCDLDVKGGRCHYWVDDRTRWWGAVSGPGRDRLHTGYYGPERAVVRDALRDAVRDYNAHGETDVEPPTRQTRRSLWRGGRWD